jgi:hypothetical protein
VLLINLIPFPHFTDEEKENPNKNIGVEHWLLAKSWISTMTDCRSREKPRESTLK